MLLYNKICIYLKIMLKREAYRLHGIQPYAFHTIWYLIIGINNTQQIMEIYTQDGPTLIFPKPIRHCHIVLRCQSKFIHMHCYGSIPRSADIQHK
ncbi:hypothetical protein XELAEV_18028676mg [Xenopus laevis]|uniref:Uncharacterized protein n=1 Tax=Xenopus laevis TaxID=8355 RepID=A0A974HH30_XENLA|nr:hypothetical protein XELAEV_18028676mg [Xenopus laevis]